MAKTLIVQLTCDRCKAERDAVVEGAETVSFAFDGFSYGLDLCKEHTEEFHGTVQSMISWSTERTRLGGQGGRRVPSPAGSPAEPEPPRRSPADRERLKAIREWARENGHPGLGDRGRVPQEIMAAYEAAH